MPSLSDAVPVGPVVEVVRALGPSAVSVIMAGLFIWALLKVAPLAKEITGQWAQAHKDAAALCKEGQDDQAAVMRECMSLIADVKATEIARAAREERLMRLMERLEAKL